MCDFQGDLLRKVSYTTGKAHTYVLERMKNRLSRHYFARVARKNSCYSKRLQMIKYSFLPFMHRNFIVHMKI